MFNYSLSMILKEIEVRLTYLFILRSEHNSSYIYLVNQELPVGYQFFEDMTFNIIIVGTRMRYFKSCCLS